MTNLTFHHLTDTTRKLLFLSYRRDHFVAEKIISAMTTHFSGMEKIFLVPDTSFFAAKMMFSVAEKTVGAVPAGLFLNHQPFNIRVAFAFWRSQTRRYNMAPQVTPRTTTI